VSAVVDEDPPEPHPCDGEELISFDGFPHGTVLAEQYATVGVHVSAEALNRRRDAVVVFDSGSVGTLDLDLEIGIGNLAIIPEDVHDEDGDGLVDSPSDSYSGGTQVYTFDQDRKVLYVVVVDMDTQALQEIKTFDATGAEIATVLIPADGGGSVQTIEVGAQGVRQLKITYWASGAIAEICLAAQD